MAKRFFKTDYPGVEYSINKDGNKVFRVLVKDGNGSWVRKRVNKPFEKISPKTASARRMELQNRLDEGTDYSSKTYTFQEAFEAFLAKRRADNHSTRLEIYRWEKHLKRFGNHTLSQLTTPIWDEYKTTLREAGLSEAYMQNIFSQARTIFNLAVKNGLWSGRNPLGKESTFTMPRWKNTARPTRWFTREEADALLTEIRVRSEQLYQMSLLSLRTGMRATEIFSLGELGDAIDAANGRLNFISKTKNQEFVYADSEIISMLQEYNRDPGELIFQTTNGKRISGVSHTFIRAVQACGLDSPTYKVWFHSWRHTFGSWLAQSGKFTLHEIMDIMRHKDISMTTHYAKLIPEKLQNQLLDHIKHHFL